MANKHKHLKDWIPFAMSEINISPFFLVSLRHLMPALSEVAGTSMVLFQSCAAAPTSFPQPHPEVSSETVK